MRPLNIPTPVENKGGRPYRIYADLYGDPDARAQRPVSEAMSLLVTVAPTVPLSEVRQLLIRQQLPAAPVVDPGDRLLGIVGWRELLQLDGETPCARAMRHALALPSWTPVGKAAAIMASESIDLAAVVDYERRAIGLLAALDLAAWMADAEGYVMTRRR
jgi:CBS domain-containing protein